MSHEHELEARAGGLADGVALVGSRVPEVLAQRCLVTEAGEYKGVDADGELSVLDGQVAGARVEVACDLLVYIEVL